MSVFTQSFIWISLLFLVNCNESTITKENDKTPLLESNKTELLHIFITSGYDEVFLPTIKKALERKRAKEINHIFYHPSAAKALDAISNEVAIKHPVNETELFDAIKTTITSSDTKRVVLFLQNHGATNGNLCYGSSSSCLITGADFITLFKKIDIINQEKDQKQKIDHIAIIAASCYSFNLKNQIFTSNIKDLTLNISMLHMSLNDMGCSVDISNSLIDNSMMISLPHLGKGKIFAQEINKNNLAEHLLYPNTLDELIDTRNTIYGSPVLEKSYSVSHNHPGMVIPLHEFGLFPRVLTIYTRFFSHLYPDLKDFKKNKTVKIKDILKTEINNDKIIDTISTVKFFGKNGFIPINDTVNITGKDALTIEIKLEK